MATHVALSLGSSGWAWSRSPSLLRFGFLLCDCNPRFYKKRRTVAGEAQGSVVALRISTTRRRQVAEPLPCGPGCTVLLLEGSIGDLESVQQRQQRCYGLLHVLCPWEGKPAGHEGPGFWPEQLSGPVLSWLEE